MTFTCIRSRLTESARFKKWPMAARERGYRYMAITDHSKNLAFANGLDDKRAEAHIKRIREIGKTIQGITVFAGIEVDILGDGELDLSDSVLEQMDIVIASIHSHFNQDTQQVTDRLLRVIENPHTSRDRASYGTDAVAARRVQL